MRKSRLPRTNSSLGLRKNQPPATDIMNSNQTDGEKEGPISAKTLPAAETKMTRGFRELAGTVFSEE